MTEIMNHTVDVNIGLSEEEKDDKKENSESSSNQFIKSKFSYPEDKKVVEYYLDIYPSLTYNVIEDWLCYCRYKEYLEDFEKAKKDEDDINSAIKVINNNKKKRKKNK